MTTSQGAAAPTPRVRRARRWGEGTHPPERRWLGAHADPHGRRGGPAPRGERTAPHRRGPAHLARPEQRRRTALQLEVVDGPEATDQEIADGGATVYLEPDVADLLDDKVLDAQVDETGVSFAIRDRAVFDPMADGHPG